MNLFVFMGRLTKEPSVRYTQQETCVADFTLAVDRRKEETDFFQMTAYGKQAEFAEKYLHKGTKVVVSGRVENNNYTGKDGQKVYGMRFVVSQIEFAESKKDKDDFVEAGNIGLPFN